MSKKELIERRIRILKKIKTELRKQKDFIDVDNPEFDNVDYFVWAGTPDGIIGNGICHYEFIVFPRKSNNLTVEIHFENKKYMNLFENIIKGNEFLFTDWDNGKHKRIVFNNRSFNLDNPDIDDSQIISMAMDSLTYLHKKLGKQLLTILQDKQIFEDIRQYYLANPKLDIGEGSIVRNKYYKAISFRKAKHLNTLHGDIQNYLYNDKKIREKYDKIQAEKTFMGLNYRIDLLAKLKNQEVYDLFEVKTADTAEACIKEALGQILFYKYLLIKGGYKINRLIIVGPAEITNTEKIYLNYLRNSFPELDYKDVRV